MPPSAVVGEKRDRESRHAVIARWTFNLIFLGGMIAVFQIFHDHVTQNVLTIGWVALSVTLCFIYRAKFNLNHLERPVAIPAVWQRKPDPSSGVQSV